MSDDAHPHELSIHDGAAKLHHTTHETHKLVDQLAARLTKTGAVDSKTPGVAEKDVPHAKDAGVTELHHEAQEHAAHTQAVLQNLLDRLRL